MKHGLLWVTYLLVLVACTSEKQLDTIDYSRYVNPFIGTDFTGNTYPGAQVPFGMVQLSPDNGLSGWNRISGYFYPDTTIAGFSHTHLSGTGAGDLYDISFMPVIRPYKEAPAPLGIYSTFSHAEEFASAGYYRVFLKDYKILVELTTTERCGIQRYTFPKAEASVFLNLKKAMNWDFTLDSQIEVVDSVTVRGYRFSQGWSPLQHVYFETRFSKPFVAYHIDTTAIITKQGRIGTASVARFDFNTKEGEKVLVTTGISGVSIEGARRNLQVEVPLDDFEFYRKQAAMKWNKQLSKIEVVSKVRDDLVKFYTALYHTMLAPTIYSDIDSLYYGSDQQIHKTDGWTNYSTFSLWDTYRASHPLFTYTQPERTNDMIKSFLHFYEQIGALPLWNLYGWETNMMIGYHAIPVIVDAYLKGIGDFDPEKALMACVTTANRDDYQGIGDYKRLGYVPAYGDSAKWTSWSLSKTLEYAYDDYCIAVMAEKMGKKEIANEFYKRALNYRNVYNPITSFMQPRDEKGDFVTPFSPDDYTEDICESNGWQYFWSVPQDLDGLIGLLGSKERFAEKLDSMFTYVPKSEKELPIFSTGMIGQYAHGNEPSHHVIYLYNKIGQPWKTQQYVTKVLHDLYLNAPDGICGNEDCGQMSAWFVFSSMGFYPVDPICGRYEIGSPLFSEVRMHLANGKTFTVLAPEVSRKNIYIQSVKRNGQLYDKSYITHEQIMNGDTFFFEMGEKPGPVWYNEF
ncbi:MAG: GH92 family glycosyl hydrolase [Parabacteroides sp.]|nr:GH92 family glycosyl hydrolase [Parabacteroides sp.]